MTWTPIFRSGLRVLPLAAPLLAATLAATLAGCGDGKPGTPGDPVGTWRGTFVTDKGSCPTATPSRLLVGSEDISFMPGDGVLVLHGKRKAETGVLHAQLLLQDMNHKPLPMVFEGTLRADGSAIDGTYGTPACRAHVALVRPVNHPLQRALGD